MPKYVNADALADRLDALAYDDWNQGVSVSWADALKDLARIVREESAADAELVGHGQWLTTPTGWLYCSECGGEPPCETNIKTNYCPNCGAKMEVEDV